MTHPSVAWGIGLTLLGLCGACLAVPALATDPQLAPSETGGGSPDHGAALLGMWPRCSSPETIERAQPICVGIDQTAQERYNAFLHLLHSGARDLGTLCYIDTTIVRSLRDCDISRPRTGDTIRTADRLNALVITLAQAWWEQGDLVRADELFRFDFEGLGGNWKDRFFLEDWASVKLALGDSDAAKDLADRYVAYNRELYACDKGLREMLMAALKFQVEVRQSLEDAKGVEDARKELQALSALAGERCPEGVCIGSPGNDGGCIERHEPE